jgi:hypothetical protein
VDRELGQVGLADHDRSRSAQAPHHLPVAADRIGEGVGPMARRFAGEIVVVLERHRDAEQRTLVPAPQPRLRLLGFGQGPLREHHAEAVQQRVEPVDPIKRRLNELGRRDLPRTHQLGLPDGVGEGEVVRHLRAEHRRDG